MMKKRQLLLLLFALEAVCHEHVLQVAMCPRHQNQHSHLLHLVTHQMDEVLVVVHRN